MEEGESRLGLLPAREPTARRGLQAEGEEGKEGEEDEKGSYGSYGGGGFIFDEEGLTLEEQLLEYQYLSSLTYTSQPNLTKVDWMRLPPCYGPSKRWSQQDFGLALQPPHPSSPDARIVPAFSWRTGGDDVDRVWGSIANVDEHSPFSYGPDGYWIDVLDANELGGADGIGQLLHENKWIDEGTAAVVAKMNFRSENDALIVRCNMIFEYTEAGHVTPSMTFDVYRYTSAIEDSSAWRQTLETWTAVMTLYYLYLQVSAIRVGKRAFRAGELDKFIFGTSAVLNCTIGSLLLASFVMHWYLTPNMIIGGLDIQQLMGLNLSQPLPPSLASYVGDSTWLTFRTYPVYNGLELFEAVIQLDALIFLILIIKTTRYFQLIKVCRMLFDAINASILDLIGTFFIYFQLCFAFGLLLMQLVSLNPVYSSIATLYNMLFTMGYMSMGFLNEVDYRIMEEFFWTGTLYFIAFDVFIFLVVGSLALAVLCESFSNARYLIDALQHNKQKLKDMDAYPRKALGKRMIRFFKQSRSDLKHELQPMSRALASMRSKGRQGSRYAHGALEKPLRHAAKARAVARAEKLRSAKSLHAKRERVKASRDNLLDAFRKGASFSKRAATQANEEFEGLSRTTSKAVRDRTKAASHSVQQAEQYVAGVLRLGSDDVMRSIGELEAERCSQRYNKGDSFADLVKYAHLDRRRSETRERIRADRRLSKLESTEMLHSREATCLKERSRDHQMAIGFLNSACADSVEEKVDRFGMRNGRLLEEGPDGSMRELDVDPHDALDAAAAAEAARREGLTQCEKAEARKRDREARVFYRSGKAALVSALSHSEKAVGVAKAAGSGVVQQSGVSAHGSVPAAIKRMTSGGFWHA